MQEKPTRDLTADEHALLIELLEEEIPGLWGEIRHTADRHYREDLKARKHASLALLTKLRHAATL